MFVLPNDVVKKILTGKINYNSLPYNNDNEITKGFIFEDQALVNLELVKKHVPMCRALEKPCSKEKCRLFAKKSGKIPDGWVCREYQLDFPSAPFDSRFHVALLGIDEINFDLTKKRFKELEQEGARYVCLVCKNVYAKKPEQTYDDGHGGRIIEMCSCGSDLFDSIDSFVERL